MKEVMFFQPRVSVAEYVCGFTVEWHLMFNWSERVHRKQSSPRVSIDISIVLVNQRKWMQSVRGGVHYIIANKTNANARGDVRTLEGMYFTPPRTGCFNIDFRMRTRLGVVNLKSHYEKP